MARATDRVSTQEFVVAVRERHEGALSAGAHRARLALAEEYLDADMAEEAIEVLLGATIDARRLYGPADDRTVDAGLALGDAYASIGRPFDACGVYDNLVADVREARVADDPLVQRVGAVAEAAYQALEDAHCPVWPHVAQATRQPAPGTKES